MGNGKFVIKNEIWGIFLALTVSARSPLTPLNHIELTSHSNSHANTLILETPCSI